MVKAISPEELKKLLATDDAFALIDVRERNEYEQGQIFGATQIPRSSLEAHIPVAVPVKATKTVVYGGADSRAMLAAQTLEMSGYTDVYCLAGGVNAWREAGYPLVEGVHVLSKAFGEIVGDVRKMAPTVTPQRLKKLLDENPDEYIIIEVRPPAEVGKTGSLPGAINIPGVEIPLRIIDYVKTGKTIITTCAGRTRGFIACATLKLMGLEKVFDLNNGTLGWQLAGYDLAPNVPQGPMPSVASRQEADKFAARLAKEAEIKFISGGQLKAMQQEASRETLYVIDVRSLEEYAFQGHIPGSIAVPGGQAIQNTDDTMVVNKANVVFVCDNGTRATITAYWYKQMGFGKVSVLEGGLNGWTDAGHQLERGMPQQLPMGFSETAQAVARVDAVELKNIIAKNPDTLVVDVSDSKSYASGHIPGAYWVPRGRLEARIGDSVKDENVPLVVTSHDPFNPVFAAAVLAKLGYKNVRALAGGNSAWKEAGNSLATGLGDIRPDDWHVHLTEYGHDEAERYFAWEESLVQLPEYMDYFRRKGIL